MNRHNVRIWGMENPHEMVEHIHDSPKVIVFLQLPLAKYTDHFPLQN
jgi:hypothetical protein